MVYGGFCVAVWGDGGMKRFQTKCHPIAVPLSTDIIERAAGGAPNESPSGIDSNAQTLLYVEYAELSPSSF